ncbi:MAG: ParB/RepB/Spo0J family partition protein [Clostridia bacterium]|nr:ParB/RepB/Spo0J family partition protein [Clostridia bacterium]
MAVTKRALGKGLDSIFSENIEEEKSGLTMLRLADIEPRKGQPRKVFDPEALSQLADSIAANGVIQPIVVRRSTGGFYEIIAGERRWRASKMAGLTEVPVVIMDIDDQKTAELSLIENIQREDLNPVEEASAYKILMENFSLTQEMLAQRVGKSRSAITNSIRLLDLPADVLKHLSEGDLSAGHARALLGMIVKSEISKTAEFIIEKGLSVRATEDLVRKLNHDALKPQPEAEEEGEEKGDVNYIAELEKALRRKFGRKIKIFHGKKSKRLEIEFTDDRDLEALLAQIGGDNLL